MTGYEVAATKKTSIEEFLSRLKEEFKITAEPVGCFLNILIDCCEGWINSH